MSELITLNTPVVQGLRIARPEDMLAFLDVMPESNQYFLVTIYIQHAVCNGKPDSLRNSIAVRTSILTPDQMGKAMVLLVGWAAGRPFLNPPDAFPVQKALSEEAVRLWNKSRTALLEPRIPDGDVFSKLKTQMDKDGVQFYVERRILPPGASFTGQQVPADLKHTSRMNGTPVRQVDFGEIN